jgi:hypothetical protein
MDTNRERPAGVDSEVARRFLRRHDVLVHKTRDVAHQALYFLGLMLPTTSETAQAAVDDYRPFGMYQVRSLVRGVHLSVDGYEEAHRLAEAGAEPWRSQSDEIEQAYEDYRLWRSIHEAVEDPETADPADLRERMGRYLRISRRRDSKLRRTLGWMHKNLAALWAVALVTGVVGAVEAVNVLLRNQGLYLLVPVVLLLVPPVTARLLSHRSVSRPSSAVPHWDLGGPPFRSYRAQAREPGGMIDRWPEDNGLKRRTAILLCGSLLGWLLAVGGASFLVTRSGDAGEYTLAAVLLAGLVFYVFAGARWLRGASLPWRVAAGHVVKLTAFLLWWLAVIAIYGVLIHFFQLPDSALTVFLILSIVYFVLLVAHLLDFWDFLDRRAVRFNFLIAGAAALACLVGGQGRLFFLVVFGAAGLWFLVRFARAWKHRPASLAIALILGIAAVLLWVGRNTHRNDEWTNDGEKVLDRLGAEDWPFDPDGEEPVVVLAASGGGSRAAFYTALTLQHLHADPATRPIAERLEAISSVSGGSLATAAYVARRYHDDKRLGLLEVASDDQEPKELLHEAVGRDFLYPTLKGALVPGTSRGREIERAWDQEYVGLGGLRLSDLREGWREARDEGEGVPFPIPLFNATTLDAHAVVISPLSRELYTRPGLREEAREDEALGRATEATWVHYRDGVYGLEDFLDRHDPKLSAAVRASANFPFGFPLVLLRDPVHAPFYSPGWKSWDGGTVSLTDGGALSNSGMWTLTHLLANRAEVLRERGVLLVIVEASKMPRYGGVGRSIRRLWGTIGDQAPIAQNLHRRMLDPLEAEYRDESGRPRIAVVQVDLVPRDSHNVLTTWALDRTSRETLEDSFDQRWGVERENLLAAWRALESGEEPPESMIARRRPPLD